MPPFLQGLHPHCPLFDLTFEMDVLVAALENCFLIAEIEQRWALQRHQHHQQQLQQQQQLVNTHIHLWSNILPGKFDVNLLCLPKVLLLNNLICSVLCYCISLFIIIIPHHTLFATLTLLYIPFNS